MPHISAASGCRDENSFRTCGDDVGAMFGPSAMFTARGFSHSTIKTLVISGIDAPERLLFAKLADLQSIPGIDENALGEIARYRAQFAAI
jgi:hypothetical protein